MSSAGIRPSAQRAAPAASQPPVAQARRPGEEPLADGGRREPPLGPRRPLPPVAAPQAPVHRPSTGPRPPSLGAEGKSQRPEKRLTKEEYFNMMRSGQLGALQSPGGPAAGARVGPSPRGPCPRHAGPRSACARTRQHARARSRTWSPPARTWSRTGTRRRSAGPRRPRGSGQRGRRRRRAKGKGRLVGGSGRPPRPPQRARHRTPRDLARARLPRCSMKKKKLRRSRGGRKAHKSGGHRLAVAPTRKSRAPSNRRSRSAASPKSIGIKANELLRKLMALGQMATINTSLDDDLATMLSMEFGVELESCTSVRRRTSSWNRSRRTPPRKTSCLARR